MKNSKIWSLSKHKFATSVLLLLGFVLMTANIKTILAADISISRNATLRAYISSTDDHIPPTQPALIETEGDICNPRPSFSWRSATDNIGVSHYRFKLTSSSGTAFFEINKITDNFENDDYQLWIDHTGYHLKIKKDLVYDNYTWWVSAVDAAGNETFSATWQLNYLAANCQYNCSLSPNKNFSLTLSSSVDSLRPAIQFDFDPTNTPSSFDVLVDGVVVFTGVPLTNLTTSAYLVNTNDNKVVFQALRDYLPSKAAADSSYRIQVVLHDSSGCDFTATSIVTYTGATGACPHTAPVPILITPPSGSEVDSLTPSLSWQVCGQPSCLESFSVLVNDAPVSLTSVSVQASNSVASCGGGPATTYTVNTASVTSIHYNDADDPMDFNTWQVSIKASNGLSTASPVWTFKVHRYFWCTAVKTCTAGTRGECGQNGARCFKTEDSCVEGAALTCRSVLSGGITDGGDENLDSLLDKITNSWRDFWSVLTADNLSELLADMLALGFYFFPVASIIWFLPIGILIIIFPQPQGFVFDRRTLKPIKGALFSLMQQEQTIRAWLSNKHGLYRGVKLEEGSYKLVVSREHYHFPSQIARRKLQALKNYYLGEEIMVKRRQELLLTYIVPLDNEDDLNKEKRDNEDRDEDKPKLLDRVRLALLRLVNNLFWLYGLTFVLVLLTTLIYPSWLNLIVLAIYFVGWCRRVLMLRKRVNVVGTVLSESGQAVAGTKITVKLLDGEGLAATTQANQKGEFELYLNPGSIYELKTVGSETYNLVATRKKQTVTLKID